MIIGLGVDDVYIILLALKKQPGYTTKDWLNAMSEVVIPVTMTSFVNASMFAVLNVNDIPAIYLSKFDGALDVDPLLSRGFLTFVLLIMFHSIASCAVLCYRSIPFRNFLLSCLLLLRL